MENKMYSAPVEQEIIDRLASIGFDQLEDSIEDELEDFCIIINAEEKLFWISDQTNLEMADEICQERYDQSILQTNFKTISLWLN
jgi:hypothetical protein